MCVCTTSASLVGVGFSPLAREGALSTAATRNWTGQRCNAVVLGPVALFAKLETMQTALRISGLAIGFVLFGIGLVGSMSTMLESHLQGVGVFAVGCALMFVSTISRKAHQ